MRPRTGVAAFATFMTAAGVLAATAAGATTAHASTTIDHKLLLEVGRRAQPVGRWQERDVHGVRGRA
jgi:hypothetical protein